MRIQLVILAAAANAAILKLDSKNEALLNASANWGWGAATLVAATSENP